MHNPAYVIRKVIEWSTGKVLARRLHAILACLAVRNGYPAGLYSPTVSMLVGKGLLLMSGKGKTSCIGISHAWRHKPTVAGNDGDVKLVAALLKANLCDLESFHKYLHNGARPRPSRPGFLKIKKLVGACR